MIQKQESQIYENLIDLKKKEVKVKTKCSCKNKYCRINHAKYSWSAASSDKLHCQLKALALDREKNNKHLKTHKNDRKGKTHECKNCDGEFCDMNIPKKHQELGPPLMSLHFCQQCDNSFEDEITMRQHKKKVHARNFGCQPCNMSYSNEEELINHIEEMHETNNQVDKTFFNPSLENSTGGDVEEV